MFDFLRDRGSTAEEKNLEALGAYLDNALPAAERERLEARLARDAGLRAELEQLRLMKRQLRAMPRRRVPRSFTLDPAFYARPKAQPLLQLYPVLRGATALTALLLIFTLALGAFRGQFSAGGGAPESATVFSEIALEEAAAPVATVETAAIEEPATERQEFAEEAVEEDLAAPREEAEAVPEAELAAPGTITDSVGIAVAPAPVGTTSPAEELPAQDAPAAGEEPPETFVEEADEPETALVVADEADEAATESGNTAFLLPLQIGLGILFLLSLIFWLAARRRSRSF
jgi:anti-sigma factor RsiW